MSRPPTSLEHEALCRRCGRCCYEKLTVDGHVFTRRKPCPYLNAKTNLCTIYEQRFKKNPRCLTVPQGIKLGVFPADCPYVRGLPDYLPAEKGWLDEEIVKKIGQGLLFSYEDIRDEMNRQQPES